ncbi:hypothetical protein [Pseudomonas argentinensis]|uniref:hypothetical protein n=1 Tax=Phytopseudomonas argentinensis TaxID=289370 RepID=UPI0008A9D7BA|nr:hypothetical protein [Pseudomonas argentinensis]
MPAKNKFSEVENQSDQTQDSEKGFFLSEEMCRKLAESQKQYRREQRRQRRLEFSWVSWFFDEFPSDDMFRPALRERRNTRQEMMYHRFRQMISWSFWSRMKSSTGVKLVAIGGLVAAFLQAAPDLKGVEAAVLPLSWLLLGGVFYLLAVICFEIRCPVLLKRTLASNEDYLGIEGRRWLLALVEDELRRWWSIKSYDMEIGAYSPESNKYQTAEAITQYGDIPVYDGFDDYASTRIEYALNEYSNLASVAMWRAEFEPNQYEKFSPVRVISPTNAPLRSFHLSRLNSFDAKLSKEGKEGDLVLRWFDSSLMFLSKVEGPHNLTVSANAEGLLYLFQNDSSALIFTRIIAQWQNTMRPWSRLLLICLFIASGGCFAWFVLLQMKILIPILM